MKKNLKKLRNVAARYVKKVRIKLQLEKEQLDIKMKRYKKVEISINDLLSINSKCNELLRLDIIVRLLAIENYYNENDFGFELYSAMQDKRVKKGYSNEAVNRFKSLIQSYEQNGYDKNSYILLDDKLNIIDGSHRIAMALYYDIPYITAYIVKSNHRVDYSIEWFFENGFTKTEINLINTRANLINCRRKTFSGVIWSPVTSISDDIIEDLSYFGSVSNIKRISYASFKDYCNVVRKIYSIDDIEDWKIDAKIEHMNEYAPELISFEIEYHNPDFRIKKASGLPLSKQVERTKRAIRGKYKKYIENYYFDIIIHVADNFYQSDYMKEIF